MKTLIVEVLSFLIRFSFSNSSQITVCQYSCEKKMKFLFVDQYVLFQFLQFNVSSQVEFQFVSFSFSLQFNTCACLICVLFVPGGLVYCFMFNDRICSIVMIEICSLNKSISNTDVGESVRQWRETHTRALEKNNNL
jgi:hypothetical protein